MGQRQALILFQRKQTNGIQMQGQWLGRYTGANSGEAILELDEVGDHYEGKAYIFEDEPTKRLICLRSTAADRLTLNLSISSRGMNFVDMSTLCLRTNSCFVVKATTDGGCGQPSTGRRAPTKLAPK
jgi:hypothetical protein